MKLLPLVLALAASGCAATPIDLAINRANAAHALALQAQTVRAQICTDGYKHARGAAAVAELDLYCLPLKMYLARYEDAWRALSAAIVAARLGMMPIEEHSLLADREQTLWMAGKDLAIAIAGGPPR